MKSSFSIAILTTILMPLALSAAVPSGVPAGSSAPPGGYFSQYFQNLVTAPTCTMPVLTGFYNGGTGYATPKCQSFGDLMKSFFALYPGSAGQVVTGFSPTTGAPTYGPGSPWLSNGTSVYYNAGNVGIGMTSPTAKLEVNGKIKMTSQTISADSNDTVATKKYVDDNALTSLKGFSCPLGQFMLGFSPTGNPTCGTPVTIVHGSKKFTFSALFEVPAGISSLKVTMVGGGGAGGVGFEAGGQIGGGGGGGGGYYNEQIVNVIAGNTYPIVVGAGGIPTSSECATGWGGRSGAGGNTSAFGLVATGGGGGTDACRNAPRIASPGGVGGSPGGTNGAVGGTNGNGGNGGTSLWGTAGVGMVGIGIGGSASGFGAGGGGAGERDRNKAHAGSRGGYGSAGFVLIEW